MNERKMRKEDRQERKEEVEKPRVEWIKDREGYVVGIRKEDVDYPIPQGIQLLNIP